MPLPPLTTAKTRRPTWQAYRDAVGEYLYGIRWKLLRRVLGLLALRLFAGVCALPYEWVQPVCIAISEWDEWIRLAWEALP